jgi:hypothetical protein
MAFLDVVTLPVRVGLAATRVTLALGELVAADGPVRRPGGYAERLMNVIGEDGYADRLDRALSERAGTGAALRRLADAMAPDRPLGRALAPGGALDRLLAPDGPLHRILDEDGALERLLAQGGPLDQVLAPGGPLDRLLAVDGALDRITREGGVLDRLLQEEGLLERAIAEDGAVERLVAEGGAVERLVAEGGALDPEAASRPWDKGRDGFVLGEGAAVLVLESEEHATARGARVYAEAAGAGITADSHDIAQPDPAGRGATRAMAMALREAEMTPGEIAHINAHATSTPQGDLAEAAAIKNALGEDAASDLVLTSTKSMTGHLLGAAGALESLSTVLALYHRVVPPTINLEDPEEIGLDVATEPRKLGDGPLAALNNSFGFGGHNVAIAFRSA